MDSRTTSPLHASWSDTLTALPVKVVPFRAFSSTLHPGHTSRGRQGPLRTLMHLDPKKKAEPKGESWSITNSKALTQDTK
jgi:hypothetical protein